MFAGQCRLIELGFRQGGPAGYGLRRQLVDQTGAVKTGLTRGEHKSIQTDRVVLIPGPPEEIETVRWIYRAFVEGGKPEREIATLLNERGVRTDLGRRWTRGTVHQILINEKYVGNNVWNRMSFKLKKIRVINQPDVWIRADGAFESIVDQVLFDAANSIIRDRSKRLSDDEMLERLRKLYEAHGYLSGIIIDDTEYMPSSSAYLSRFGSLVRAYQQVGFAPDRDYSYIDINRALRAMHPEVVQETIDGILLAGGSVQRHPATDLLLVNEEFSVSIVIVRCAQTPAGSLRWHIRFDTGLAPAITVAVRMDEGNRARLDYYLLPSTDMFLPRLRLAERNGISIDAYCYTNLDPLFAMAERMKLKEAA